MHHGSGPQNVQHQLQRSRAFAGSEGEEQQARPNPPQSPATPFAPAASPSAPQSPGYQVQQLMNRSPVAGQSVNIALQNVGPVVGGNPQITLAPLPLPSPTSPGFQFSAQQRRFEHGSPSYIQVTSPLSQQVQTQSPTQPSPGPGPGLQSVRAGAPGPGLGLCSSSPTGGFVDASVLVRQISLSPSSGGHFVFQEGSGLAQMAPGAQVQLQHTGAPITVRERRLSQPHAQSGGTVHHLGPQSPAAAGGAGLQPLSSPGHITTTSLPPQISSIIQGQLIQQQQVLQGPPLTRPLLPGVGGTSAFGMTSPPPPTSPSRTAAPPGLSSLPVPSAGSAGIRKAPRKLEEIPAASQELAQMRKQCLDYHFREMEALKAAFKEYLVELFFLQHLQGNMMDFLAFKKKHYAPLQAYLRQNDLDLEEEDEDEDEEKSEVINDEQQALAGTLVAGAGSVIETDPFKRQQAGPPAEQSKRPRLEVGHQGVVFQHPGVNTGVPLQQLMPTVQGGMPPAPQAAQLAGQKQSQQRYDPSTGPPVQNAASLHTPPPQLPARLPPAGLPAAPLPPALQFPPQPQTAEPQTPLPVPVKTQPPNAPAPAPPAGQLPAALHVPVPAKAQMQAPPLPSQPQTAAPPRPPMDPAQPCPRPLPSASSASTVVPASGSGPGPSPARASPVNRPSPAAKSLSPVIARSPGAAVSAPPKPQSPAQNAAAPHDGSQDKLAEQIALENQIHQRIADLRKEGLWSLRRLPKLQEAPRSKSHWDYLLEEMQWMATDFAQERRWKVAAAKKLVRTVVRHHEEKQLREERGRREEQNRLRRIAASTAREIEYFWSNIEQVVEIKLQVELEEKRKKALNFQKVSRKVEDEEETIAEEEALEGAADHQAELLELAREAELPLIDLMKLYEGAFLPNFQWPQPKPDSEETSEDEDMEDCSGDRESRKGVVLIDSLFIMDQFKATERVVVGKPHTKDIAEVTAVAEAILPKGSARISTAVKLNAPALLYGALRDYQKIGLDWLAKLYRKNLNGVLADEAGLGKTVQIIAFFAHLACNEGNWGPHLVVVRGCNILKWELELKRWCPGLKTLLYVGSHRELKAKRQGWTEPNRINVCITSYKQFFKGYASFTRVRWKCLVIDEMQRVKGMTERHWEAVFTLQSQQRLLLIDAPLHNTFLELWTMVHFLIPGISRPYLHLPLKAPSEENQDYYHKVVIRLHRVTQPFILRRTKRDVEKQLTKKYEHVLKCRLSNRQKALYEDVILQPGTQEALKSGRFVDVLSILLRLQRICNHPGLVAPRLPESSYTAGPLQCRSASLILKALDRDLWKETDLSIFDLIGLENKMTRHESELLGKKKVTRKLFEELFTAPPPSGRPAAVRLKPSRLFQPVQYGQKPEGRTVAFPSTHPPRTATPTATATPQGHVRGRPPIATFSANPDAKGGEVVKIAQLPESPVTLQFQGNKFTLSHSQLRQLTARPLPLQLVLQIVSAPGQSYLRPPGPVVMQTVSQAGALNALGSKPPAGGPSPAPMTPPVGVPSRLAVSPLAAGEPGVASKPASPIAGPTQEEKTRLLKERLDQIYFVNERRCSRSPVYGRDLLGLCSLPSRGQSPWLGAPDGGHGKGAGPASRYTPPSTTRRDLILTLTQRQESLQDVMDRVVCVIPPVVAAPPCLWVARPPSRYSHKMRLFRHYLREHTAPFAQQLQRVTALRSLRFPELRLVQFDSGKLEALAILLQKLKSEGRRVLILSQMFLMLDILEMFLNFHYLTYIRIDENANSEQRQDLMRSFNRDRRVFCALLSTHSRATGVSLVEADAVVFYDHDLNPVMDAKAQEWCDRIGRRKDVHIYRLVSGNSIEEKLLKNGTKDLIREVAAQGNDYSMAFLTQRTIQELFEVYPPMDDTGFPVKAEEFVVLSQEPSVTETIAPKIARPFIEVRVSIECSGGGRTRAGRGVGAGSRRPDGSRWGEEPSPLEELTPIEKYALNYLELFHTSTDQDKERNSEVREGEFVYEGADGQTEVMPLWTPPTPPQDDNDIYIDSVMCLMYESTPIPESKLPPVYVRKERRRHKTDPSAAGRKKKQRHGEAVVPPRSLFDRATPGMLKIRREGKEQKKNILEDWALLQAVKQLLELPLNLTVVSPAHTPNWDLVSDVVNSCSRIYRSSKQCRNRYENVLIPREEGKSKNNRPLRTGQMYAQDENATHTQLYTSHFDLMKMTAGKRSPPIKPLLGMNPFQKNPKHASVLAESGINYDKPLPPIQVASLRAERIAKEKKALADQQKAQQPPVAQPPPPPPPPQPQPPPPQQPPPPLPQPPSAGSQQPAGPPAVQPQAQAQPPAQPTPPPPKAPPAITTVGSAAVLVRRHTERSAPARTVSGNVIVNTIAGVPAATFQSINKRLASPVAPGALTTSGGSAPAQVVHTQPRAVGSPATATSDMVSPAPTQGVRAVTSVTASAVVTTSLTPVQTPTRSLVTQVSQATGVQLPGKTITPAHFQLLRQQQQQQQQASQVQVPQIQGQAQAPAQIKAVGKLTPEHLIKMQKQKLQLPQQAPPAQAPPGPPQPTAQVQVQPPQPTQQQSPQLTTVTAPRPGALLTGTTVANLQVARLTRVPTSQLQAQGQMQAPAPQPAQVALAKPPVVSVPAAVVSSPGVTTLPMNVAGISVAIGQPQKAAGQTVVAQPVHVQQLLKLKQQAVQQQKAIQPQAAPGPAAVQQKITAQQIAAQGQPQKVTYATQPALKTQFLTTPISQAQKLAGTQQVQTQIQVAKLPQVVQQQTPVASIQQVASASQQASPQTVTLTQATAAGQQVQVIPAVTATAQVVQQKLMQQQVVTTAAAQLQTPGVPNPAQVPASSDSPNQQPKLQMRVPAVRLKTPTKPPCP
uniref:E1A binding protein p400 n=1 Tax=Phocoena sinus TaxID=42100 RepID=A0A8C9CBN9_PHOSS